MSRIFIVSNDQSRDWEERAWPLNVISFCTIFDRVETFFRSHEQMCKEKCYEDTGVGGIDLATQRLGETQIDDRCFNIFCLRCKEALEHFPDERWTQYIDRKYETLSVNERRSFDLGMIAQWKEVIKRFEMDPRYDAEWIDLYRKADADRDQQQL